MNKPKQIISLKNKLNLQLVKSNDEQFQQSLSFEFNKKTMIFKFDT